MTFEVLRMISAGVVMVQPPVDTSLVKALFVFT
jgi:hypothetical protein